MDIFIGILACFLVVFFLTFLEYGGCLISLFLTGLTILFMWPFMLFAFIWHVIKEAQHDNE